jgi:cation:H+ antiporter
MMPQLMMTVAAAIRGDVQLSAGQILISGVWNILGVLAAVTLIHAFRIAPLLATQDLLVMAVATGFLMALLSMQWRIGRGRGLLLVAAYAGYLVFLGWRQGLWTPAMLGL